MNKPGVEPFTHVNYAADGPGHVHGLALLKGDVEEVDPISGGSGYRIGIKFFSAGETRRFYFFVESSHQFKVGQGIELTIASFGGGE